MRRLHRLLLASALLACAPLWSQTAPSHPNPEVAALLNKMAEAYGGWDKVRSVRAIRRQSTGSDSKKTWHTDLLLLPDRMRVESDYLGFPVSIIVSPATGVALAEGHGDLTLPPEQKESYSTFFRFDIFFLLQQASSSAYQFSVLEGERIGGVETRILEVKGYGVRGWLYVDLQTGRILRDLELGADGGRTTNDYSDWFTAHGITGPVSSRQTTVNSKGEPDSVEFRTTAFELNPPVDYRLFERYGPSLANTAIHPAPMLPAPEPPRSVNLSIRTQPGNAQVYLNDEFRGTSSSEGILAISNLKPGSYRLRVTVISYKEWTQGLELAAGNNQTIDARLESAGPKPLELRDIEEALQGGVSPKRVTELVKQFGVDFALTDEVEQRLRALGADSDLLLAISRGKK
jgi:hypothetical protein